MKVVAAIDWSDETFSAVQALTQLYAPRDLTLVHAVDVRPFESPLFAPNIAKQAYAEFRQALVSSGQQLLEQTAAALPADVAPVHRLCEVGAPGDVILDTVRAASADLLVLGSRGRGRLSELVLGSVSHSVLLQAPCSTLLIKRPIEAIDRVLVAVEGSDDADRLGGWLRSHPFRRPVEVTVLNVVPNPYFGDPGASIAYASWTKEAEAFAHQLVDGFADSLKGTLGTVATEVVLGFPTEAITNAASRFDLVVMSSHGRKGIARVLLGSVSHAVVHRIACPILLVR